MQAPRFEPLDQVELSNGKKAIFVRDLGDGLAELAYRHPGRQGSVPNVAAFRINAGRFEYDGQAPAPPMAAGRILAQPGRLNEFYAALSRLPED